MLIIGLTGSIGMGKSTAAERFRHNGIEVFDADACVHALYSGEAAPLIEKAFPGTTSDGKVDRKKLTEALMTDPGLFKKLESIVHPLVRKAEAEFLKCQKEARAKLAVLEIPLLFETGADKIVDVTVVTSASAETQRERVMERAGMTDEKFREIQSRQMDDAEKRQRADYIVDTNGEISQSHAQIDKLVAELKARANEGDAFENHWM